MTTSNDLAHRTVTAVFMTDDVPTLVTTVYCRASNSAAPQLAARDHAMRTTGRTISIESCTHDDALGWQIVAFAHASDADFARAVAS